MENFVNLLTKSEVNTLIRKLRKYRETQGSECTNDEILILVSWAREIRRNDRLLTLFLSGDLLADVNCETGEVFVIR